MRTIHHEASRIFHLENKSISYIVKILPSERVGQMYSNELIRGADGSNHIVKMNDPPMVASVFKGDKKSPFLPMERDYITRETASRQLSQSNSSRITDFTAYVSNNSTAKRPISDSTSTGYTKQDEKVLDQIKFTKEYHEIIHCGIFYRLCPLDDNSLTAWMVVSENKKTALVSYYTILRPDCDVHHRIKLYGLDPNLKYCVDGAACHYGDELINLGLSTTSSTPRQLVPESRMYTDFDSRVFVLQAK